MIHTGCNIQGLHKQTNKQIEDHLSVELLFWLVLLCDCNKHVLILSFFTDKNLLVCNNLQSSEPWSKT